MLCPMWLPLLPLAAEPNHHSTYWHCTSAINYTIFLQAARSPYYHASSTQGYKDKINSSFYFPRIKNPDVDETQI